MIGQIIDPPNLGSRTLVVIYLKSILAIFQKKIICMQVKLERFESKQK